MLSSISGVYPLDTSVSRLVLVVTTKMSPDTAKHPLGVKIALCGEPQLPTMSNVINVPRLTALQEA